MGQAIVAHSEETTSGCSNEHLDTVPLQAETVTGRNGLGLNICFVTEWGESFARPRAAQNEQLRRTNEQLMDLSEDVRRDLQKNP